MEFGSLVLEIRKKLNITQEQLAQELSISFSTVNRWENGHTSPSKLARMRLIEFCNENSVDTRRWFVFNLKSTLEFNKALFLKHLKE